MSEKKEPEIKLSAGESKDNKDKKADKTVEVLILETRAVLYGNKIIELKKNTKMEVSQDLKDRLVAAKAAKVL